jgi:hypothetical protein
MCINLTLGGKNHEKLLIGRPEHYLKGLLCRVSRLWLHQHPITGRLTQVVAFSDRMYMKFS